MDRKLAVQWFPGHMTKARRMMEQELKLIDVAVEMLDARIPYASSNPMLLEILGNKPRIIVLNKNDLADPIVTQKWIEYFALNDILTIQLDSAKGRGVKELLVALKKAAAPLTDKWLAKGVKNKTIRVMIAGIPNVGKSSLINRFANGAKVKTANKPGVTRGKQWLSVGNNLEILDTPGILWPKFENQETAFALAVTGAVKDDVFDTEQAAFMLLDFLLENYPESIKNRYNLTEPMSRDTRIIWQEIASRRGCLRSGGVIDAIKVSQLLLKEFRAGLLGRVSLDKPPV